MEILIALVVVVGIIGVAVYLRSRPGRTSGSTGGGDQGSRPEDNVDLK